eukprot:264053-Alexandrium_andersonii.AAC.1
MKAAKCERTGLGDTRALARLAQRTTHLPTLAQRRSRHRAKQSSLEPRCKSLRAALSRTGV